MPSDDLSDDLSDELLDELTALATRLARSASSALLAAMDTVPALLAGDAVDTKSSPTDMVSQVDRDTEQLIVEGILAARPDDGILGEEGADRAGSSGVRWVIDPLDGTTNYLYGLAGFVVSIGVELHGQTVVGVVADPVRDEVFAATTGRGATRDGRPIRCSDATDLAHALVGTGFSYQPAMRAEQAAVLVGLLPVVRDIRRLGAAAADLCAVACGRLDAYYEVGLHPWDLSAGTLIAREAGAVVTGPGGGPPSEALTLAGGPGLHGDLRTALVAAGFGDA